MLSSLCWPHNVTSLNPSWSSLQEREEWRTISIEVFPVSEQNQILLRKLLWPLFKIIWEILTSCCLLIRTSQNTLWCITIIIYILHLDGLVSHKNTQYQKICVYLKVSVVKEIWAHHFQLKCMGGHLLFRPSLHREYYRNLRYKHIDELVTNTLLITPNKHTANSLIDKT